MKKKNRSILFLILLSISPLFLMGGGLFLCSRTSGFSVDKITSRFPYNPSWDIPLISEKEKEMLIQNVFPQTYYYLAGGNQCYAFISEDRQFVLKFFKMHNLFPRGWLSSFPFTFLKNTGFKDEASNQLFSERIFASYKDAYEMLREETGLIYIHLNKTREIKSKVKLIDSKGKKYFVDLDGIEFIVQRKATRIFDHLKELVDTQREEDLRASIRSFLHLFAIRCEKGFVDHNLSFRNNFGFIGNTAIQFDCASLTRDSSMKYPQNFRKEILEAAERLDVWARENFPEITLFIQEEAQALINMSS